MINDTPVAVRRSIARAVIPANLGEVERAGHKIEPVDEFRFRIAGRFTFFPANGLWRSDDGGRMGYGARGLNEALKAAKSAERAQARAVRKAANGGRK